MFKGMEVPENSLVVRDAIGGSDTDTLMWVTDYTECCNTDTVSAWFIDHRNDQPIPTSGANIIMSRGDQVVRLHLTGSSNAEGIFWCRIRVAANTFQNLYVGIYGSTDPDGDGECVSVCGDKL